MRKFKRLGSAGQSAIEFAVMLPFLLILLYAAFEWGQIFIKHVRASTICREAALAIHHDCKDLSEEPVEGQETIEACMARVREEMLVRASYVFPDFAGRGDIVLSLYGAVNITVGGSASHQSRYTGNEFDQDMMATLDTMAVGEFFYDNEMMTPIEHLMEYVMPKLIYKTTVV